MLDRVTITGADDAVDIGELCELASEFPFLELAILASVSRHGTPRYPTTGWVERFTDQRFPQSSIHLCGEYARNALDGNLSSIAQWFDRCQINFKIPPIRDAWTLSGVVWAHGETQFIFQHNDDNAEFLDRLGTKCNFSCLFDASGGRGVTPTEWPTGISSIGPYCGYAGGLSPDNLERELPRIAAARGPANFWVDVESGVRTEDRFDLAKVRRVLEIAKGHMEQE